MFTPTIKLEHSDNRGEIYSIELPDGHELMLIHSRPGALRGGHSHSCDEVVVMLSGMMQYHKGDEGQVETVEGGDASYNPAGLNHMGEFVKDSWLIEYKLAKKGEWTQVDYEPMREKVRASQQA